MPDVEIVIPVYNEERVLATTVYRLHDFLSRQLRFSWQITIADNASTDCTPEIAEALSDALDGVAVLRLEQKGRGRALRAAWSASEAHVVAYMDVDLSTDLRGLLPLLAPLLSGHSEVAIGSRLARGSRVQRGPRRELISQGYSLILRTVLHARFTDAQCGFKAVRADALPELLPAIRDESWFFDTELLVLAQRRGMRIHEVPVDWVDDPDSRVAIVSTALDDLRGVARLALAGAGERAALDLVRDRWGHARVPVHRDRRSGGSDQPPPGAEAVAALALGRSRSAVHHEVVQRMALIRHLPSAVRASDRAEVRRSRAARRPRRRAREHGRPAFGALT
jgi:hypothetical protein